MTGLVCLNVEFGGQRMGSEGPRPILLAYSGGGRAGAVRAGEQPSTSATPHHHLRCKCPSWSERGCIGALG